MTDAGKKQRSVGERDNVRSLIEKTVSESLNSDPATLPHVVRRRLEQQIRGTADLDQLIAEVLKERGSA